MDRFEDSPADRPDSEAGARWSAWNFVGIAAVLLGVGLALLGVNRAITPDEPEQEAVRPPIRTVAVGVPEGATETADGGQQRVVRTSRGQLLVLFATDEGLRIAADTFDQGRTFRTPVAVEEIAADTFSVDIDERDRLHVAFADEDGIFHALLRQTQTGWAPDTPRQLDDSASGAVDISYDATREVAHVVWAAAEEEGRVPRWAGIDVSEDPVVLGEETFAEPGDAGAGINVAAGPDGTVVATYRRGDSPEGWFARVIAADAAATEWGSEESLDVEGVVSEAALAVDRRGIAHLVVADQGGSRLTYLRRARRAGWIAADEPISSGVTDPIDSPSVTVDTTSRLLYVFFRTGGEDQVARVAVWDLAGGWEGPYRIGLREDVAQGVLDPTAPRTTAGHPLVIWTTGVTTPNIEAGRIIAP